MQLSYNVEKSHADEVDSTVASFAGIFSVVTQRSSPQRGALRDDTKNACEGG